MVKLPLAALAALGLMPLAARPAWAVTRREIEEAANPAPQRLREGKGTRALVEQAKAILIFPRIVRAGFAIGGQYGTGALYAGGGVTPQAASPGILALWFSPVPPVAKQPGAMPAPVPRPLAPVPASPEPFAVMGHYNLAGASFGLQIGAQAYGLAMLFMTDSALAFFHQTEGREVGTGPSVVALDAGMAASMTSSTLSQDVYAVTFGQTGLMATLSLEGIKITRIRPD